MKPQVAKKSILITLACLVCACSAPNNGGTYKVSIPVDDGSNHYTLQTKELHTVTDIYAMSGSAAAFRADGHFDIKSNDSGKEFITGSDAGSTPSAHFLKIGDVYHPSDFMSLSMATAMYHFENIKAFYDGFNANSLLSFPRLVMVNVVVERAFSDGRHSQTINNASYVDILDFFWINPYKDDNVPLTINGAVLAHEYLHSIFLSLYHAAKGDLQKGSDSKENSLAGFEKYFNSTSELNEWYSAPEVDPSQGVSASRPGPVSSATDKPLSKNEKDDNDAANSFLFSSVNEGIADYYGYEYSQNASWIVASLPTESMRILDRSKIFPENISSQKEKFIESVKTTDSRSRLDAHVVGAYFSHFLWLVSHDSDWGSEGTKKATLEFMQNYAKLLALSHDRHFNSMGDLVKLFFKTKAPGSELCAKVQGIFPAELNDQSFPCGAVIVDGEAHPGVKR